MNSSRSAISAPDPALTGLKFQISSLSVALRSCFVLLALVFGLLGSGRVLGAISEGFETGLPTGYTATTTYTLGSGTWSGQANGVIRDSTAAGVKNGTYSCQLRSQTNAQITTPELANGVGVITVWASVSSGTGGLQILTSPDNTTFTQVTGSPIAPATTIAQFSFTVNSSAAKYVQFRRTSGTIRIDDVSITDAPGATAPTLNAAGSATVDAAFDVTFNDSSAWRSAITSITIGGITLSSGAYSTTTAGQITFTPSASTLLQSSGNKSIVISATGYNTASVTQSLGVGAANKLAMTTQPAAPATNGGTLATQPAVKIVDQYGNTTTSTASVVAAVGSGIWTIGGTTSQAGVSGTATFSGLTATSASAVTGATINFTSTGLTSITSSTFNIPAPAPANNLSSNPTDLTVNASATSGTTVSATVSSPFSGDTDVWFRFTPTTTGTATITTATSAQDIDLYVWSGTAPTVTTGNIGTGGATSSDKAAESMTVPVTAGTAYFIRVVYFVSSGSNAGPFNIAVTMPASVPAAPTITAITPGDGQLSVAFTAGSDGGSAITNYTYSTNGGSTFTAVSPASTTSPILITGLINGTSYNVQIRAVNAIGDGTASATTSASPVNPTVPTISTSGTLSAVSTPYGTASSNTTFFVSGSALAGDLTVTPPSGFEISTTASSGFSPTSLSLTAVSGTVTSTTIYVRLAAATSVGSYSGNVLISGGDATTQTVATVSSSVTAKALTITGLSAANKSFDGTTTVSVTGTPEYSGLANGDSFTVTGSVTWEFADANAGASKTLTRTGTYNAPSSNYTVTQPTLTASITAVVATAPTITAITPGNAQLSVAFIAPTSNGGASITNYMYSTDGGTTFTARSPVATTSPIVITGLTNGSSYNVQILAVNSAGDGAPSATTAATPVTTPGAPTITSVTKTGTTEISVAFTAPASNGGSAITNYKYSTNGGTLFTALSPASTSSPIVITGLAPGTAYSVQIRAVNVVGDGTATASTAFTLPKVHYPMAQGDYSLDFTDIANWTDGFLAGTGSLYWSSVAVNATGTIPDGVRTSVSSATFNTTSGSGGVQRGGLALSNNVAGTLVFLSTGTGANANSVAADLLLDFTGRTAGTLSFDHACVYNSTGNRGATLKVYTSIDGSSWTELSSASVSVVNNVTASGSKSLISLPSTLSGSSTARIRFYEYADAIGTTGSRPKVSIDNVQVSSFTTPTVATGLATGVAQTIATLGGDITATGGSDVSANNTERGVFISTTSGFTDGSGTKVSATGSFGAGAFTVNSTSLMASTTYFFKAFATNPAGTTYGAEGTFTTLAKETPSIATAPTASAITYPQTLASSNLSGGAASVSGAFSFTTPSTAPNAGTASQDVTFTPTDAGSYNTAITTVSVTVNPATLAPEGITISETNGVYSATSPDVSGFTYSYVGTNYAASATAPTTPGQYTVTATSSDPNYTGSKNQNYFIAGAIATNDNVSRQANSGGFKIPVATLLGNDNQVDAGGALVQTGLTITAVNSGTGNSVSLSGAFVFYTPSDPSASDSLTFTYTLSNGTSTATGTVTVATVAATAFSLDLIRVVTPAAFAAGETTITVEFAAVPGQTYNIEYSTNMSSWTSRGAVATGQTGTFNVTFTAPDDVAAVWNNSMFFRASR